jgi:alkanesulfonate monooxygenase SsuD/methylene tetrahydromethanopterin reductase-like flavin-dependent oxidoreductase (luciferase family)
MTDRPDLRFGIAHDFRCPPGSDYTMADVYAQTMEQIALVDRLGLDLVWFSEHHFVDDGYLPNFVPVAAAAAALTSHIRIGTDIALAPFAHPLRLAEDMGILDQLSGGRMELGLGLGYAPHEFAAFGMPRSHRVSYTEELLAVLRLAWTGDAFSFHGKRYSFDGVRITPQPVQAGGPPLWLASTSPASVERAVRFDTNVLPQGITAVVLDPWRAKMREAGRDPEAYRVGIIRSVLVTDDPERDWPPVRAAERYRMKVYGGFAEAAGLAGQGMFDPTADRLPQRIIVGDVAHCVEQLSEFVTKYGLTDVVTWGAVPGIQPAALTPMIERFAAEVVPGVRARVAT